MPMLQTEYASKPAAGAVGRRANMEEWNTITRIAEAAGIGFGQPVQRGTGDDQILLMDDGVFLGITEADQTLLDSDEAAYPDGANVPVCERGVIWVLAGATCTAGTPVYWVAADGDYTSTEGTNTLIPGAEFDSTAADGELVKVRLRRQPAAPAA